MKSPAKNAIRFLRGPIPRYDILHTTHLHEPLFYDRMFLNQVGAWFGAVAGLQESAHYVVIHKISDILCRHYVFTPIVGWGARGVYIKSTGIITLVIC